MELEKPLSEQQPPLRYTTWQAEQGQNFGCPWSDGLDLGVMQDLIWHLWWLCSWGGLEQLEPLETFLLGSSSWKHQEKKTTENPELESSSTSISIRLLKKIAPSYWLKAFCIVVPKS